jgi:hypothetical protein
MFRVLLCSASLAAVHGHASLIMPPTRNSIDAETSEWSDGKHPNTGTIEPYNCRCTNGTSDCSNGQSCFWFSQGCTIGCPSCDANGARYPSFDHCPGSPKPPPTYLNKKYWTANHNATPGSHEDIFQFNPWRAPGHAPVADACGMAGGSPVEVFNAGAFNATRFAKQGDLGTRVLAPRPSGTVWKRGSVVTTRWQQTAAHGGGYQYRLCPASEPLTEACFQKTVLEFANPQKHRAVFANSSLDRDIAATCGNPNPSLTLATLTTPTLTLSLPAPASSWWQSAAKLTAAAARQVRFGRAGQGVDAHPASQPHHHLLRLPSGRGPPLPMEVPGLRRARVSRGGHYDASSLCAEADRRALVFVPQVRRRRGVPDGLLEAVPRPAEQRVLRPILHARPAARSRLPRLRH